MKIRLDEILVNQNLAENRSKAKAMIKDQKIIYINNKQITKPGMLFENDIEIEIKGEENHYVSRAGLKLDKAIKKWEINLNNLICMDIGASTGGFTQCCLENGAKMVYSVDVGQDQLHESLKNNSKVINIEKYNFRNANVEDFSEVIDFICCDVSFISVEKILIPLKSILKDQGLGVILIKPQFESEISEVKNGKVNSKEIHLKDIHKVFKYATNNGFSVLDLTFSPIKGNKKQNIEYLALIKKENKPFVSITDENINVVINQAWLI
ncbi:TlyA family RNA methyltransferase [Mesoplasma photuris]|uniref:TlyA family RNA methyltransferase n=1 Tax=Mesoplasma photuris TaxID=217731 RepID=UPI0004E19AE6|nr:TlyA family RNA methyltransferase [Mesoplasma photuris]